MSSKAAAKIANLWSRYPAISKSYYKFKRVKCPPLPEPRESPYIVGPYLKPKYLPIQYITDPIKHREDNDLDYFIYEPTEVELDTARTVQLLLIKDVEGLGTAGQIVDAPYAFGASKLVAMRKAEYLTDFAREWYKFGPKTMESASSAISSRTIRLLKNQVFKLPVSRDATIKPWHLSMALRLSGCMCPVDAIEESSIAQDASLVKCIIVVNNHERAEVTFEFDETTRDE